MKQSVTTVLRKHLERQGVDISVYHCCICEAQSGYVTTEVKNEKGQLVAYTLYHEFPHTKDCPHAAERTKVIEYYD
jgi:hypothetical protein